MPSERVGRPFAVVTGASRGIGAEYARALAARGHDVLLVSRREMLLEELAADLAGRYGVDARYQAIDLAEPGAAHTLFVAACRQRPVADIVINNAGFGLYGRFAEMPMKELQDMIALHIQTVVETMRLFLPGMIERGAGTIINVASIAGLFPVPYLAHYAATKSFLVSLSEASAREVRDSGVRIQVCCPGSTETDFHAAAGYVPQDPSGSDSPAEVVAASLAGLQKGSTLVTVGWKGRLQRFMGWGVPRSFFLRAVGAFMKPPPKP